MLLYHSMNYCIYVYFDFVFNFCFLFQFLFAYLAVKTLSKTQGRVKMSPWNADSLPKRRRMLPLIIGREATDRHTTTLPLETFP